MNTKNIFKAVALAMLMPAMLLTTACSNDDDAVNNENTAKNGYTLPVTINVSRQDDGATRSTYTDNGNGTGTFAFGTGDQLFVWGTHSTAGKFAGSLTWTSGGTFSGIITTQNEWTSTADALFTNATSKHATLLPAGYETPGFIFFNGTGYNAQPDYDYTKAFALTKVAAVEQFSLEDTDGYTGSGFVLSPTNAILNFTITGLAASTEVAVVFTNTTPNPDDVINTNVTTDESGNAKFAIAIQETSPSSYDPGVLTLTVGGHAITINSTSQVFTAGHIYNIYRCVNAINGQFSVSSTKKVFFSKGNLQATTTDLGATWTWAFAANQWSRVGDAAANTSMKTDGTGTVTANGTVDLFGWVGASSSWTTAAKWGISSSTTSADYGNVADEALKSDWGNVPGIGTGWRTLTGGDTDSGEWDYLFNSRSASTVNGTANARYAKATVNSVAGVVLFPDSYTHPAGVTAPASINTGNINYAANSWSGEDWTKMEKAGCVFLPAGGYRNSTTMSNVGTGGYYWTSTSTGSSVYRVFYLSNKVTTSGSNYYRNYGYSVRLVHDAN